jgi:hypothetical protein
LNCLPGWRRDLRVHIACAPPFPEYRCRKDACCNPAAECRSHGRLHGHAQPLQQPHPRLEDVRSELLTVVDRAKLERLVTASNNFRNGSGCNPNWSACNIGSRSQWNITKDLYVGVDVIYIKLNSATNNSGPLAPQVVGGGKCSNCDPYTVSDQDAFAATWRIHRDIVPQNGS